MFKNLFKSDDDAIYRGYVQCDSLNSDDKCIICH